MDRRSQDEIKRGFSVKSSQSGSSRFDMPSELALSVGPMDVLDTEVCKIYFKSAYKRK